MFTNERNNSNIFEAPTKFQNSYVLGTFLEVGRRSDNGCKRKALYMTTPIDGVAADRETCDGQDHLTREFAYF